MPAPDKLSLVIYSGDFDKIHYALAMAAAALATNIPATLFFTMGAARALAAPGPDGRPGWQGLPTSGGTQDGAAMDEDFAAKGIGRFEELLSACTALGGKIMVCEMGLRAIGMEAASLRQDVPIEPGGLVTFLSDASRDGSIVFV
ncbi:DsrE family protein [Telmatospirillum sp. J64-1]|uniref:DsrE family protein n=1 Tax=Telmatospirillum sp. J64-1 TaxID=2502183 RepID=UPI00115DF7D0|nr:DsrE family protein [Telmatospirillum sp. J64-1]